MRAGGRVFASTGPLLATTLAAVLFAPGAHAQDTRLPNPGTAWVIFGTDTVVAEVAGTPEQRERGLMGRVDLPDGTGMLFVFPRSAERYLWMKDTHIPLSVAFFDDSNLIGAIKHMEPLDETLVDSEIATALLLEVRQGWFAENGIEVGATAEVVFGPGLTVHWDDALGRKSGPESMGCLGRRRPASWAKSQENA